MKKSLILILISIMWWQSCSVANLYPQREIAQVSPNCNEGIANLLAPDRDLWRRLTTDEKSAWQYTRGFRTITISDEEERWLFENFMDIEYERDSLGKIRSAILFSRTLSPKQKTTFLKEFPQLMSGELEKLSLPTKRFNKHLRKVKKYEDKMYSFEETKAKNKLSEGRIERMRKTAHEKARIYEKNYFKCVNAVADPKHVTPEGLKRANTVALAITFGGAASAMLTYSITNWDLPKDGQWWGEIAFVIVTSMAMGYVNAKWILANPKLNLWTQRFPLVMGVSAVEDLGVTALWQEVLGSDPPTDEEIKKVMEDPAFQKKMNEVMIVMEEKGLFEKHADAFQKMMEFYQVKSEDELVKLSGTGLMSLDPELINDEKTRDLFLEAITELDYKQKKGPVSLGSEEKDRYTYHRAIDFIYQPAFLIASGLMYETMCSTPNPKLAVIKAVSLFLAINVAADALYFVGRRELINQ